MSGILPTSLNPKGAEIERYFDGAPAAALETFIELDKARGRIERRAVTVSRQTDWLATRDIPPARTKAAREHRIPLSDHAIAILQGMETAKTGDYVFPGQRPGRPLSGMAFEILLRRIGSPFTTHGFRSSFRDWAGNETTFPRELAEHALSHVIGDKGSGAAHVAFDTIDRLGPCEIAISWLNPTPHTIVVYALPRSSPSTTQHSLPGGRYPLPGPDLHRLDRASFAWRTNG